MATLYASVDQVRREARQLDPVKVLLTLLLLVPFILGWAARFVWAAFALLWVGGTHGWRTASGQIASRGS